uniref:Uncharacterized protein n=1 Tax=Odontella aurita TaxID=265563 RepID=A0A7S4K9D2_9STRA|mmetsp:Transcript_7401/g.21824  ORF Transcript_7401/g.21824 Transcript_7401/m.21824 type:complete len:465 (+) Transcript_7401:161-1555(+)
MATARRALLVGLSVLILLHKNNISSVLQIGSLTSTVVVYSRSQPPASKENGEIRGTAIESKSCVDRRGSSGRWVQDWSYANRTSYPNHGSYTNWHVAEQNFTPTTSQPHRLATSYRWIDDDEDCPVSEVNLSRFCDACYDLGISQILILGDCLSTEFAKSLQSLLGFPPMGIRATEFKMGFKPWGMDCPSEPGRSHMHKITFQVMRYSPFKNWKWLGNEARARTGNARNFINGSSNRTAIVANLGVWMRTEEEYQRGFTYFIEWLDSLEDPGKVIAFWRPTVPGHTDCLPGGGKGGIEKYNWINPVLQKPHASYSEYQRAQDVLLHDENATGFGYRWELIEGWNDWSYQKLQQYHSGQWPHNHTTADEFVVGSKRSKTNSTYSINRTNGNDSLLGQMIGNNRRKKIHWLNILPSSLLRRDGHIGFGDCLHYYLPGPIDFWSHFFHSALLDLAASDTNTTGGVDL